MIFHEDFRHFSLASPPAHSTEKAPGQHSGRGNKDTALKALRARPATAKFILATGGQTLEAEDLLGGETINCAYADVPNHFGFLLPLAGISTIKEIKDNPIDVRATRRLNKLYAELLSENLDWPPTMLLRNAASPSVPASRCAKASLGVGHHFASCG